MKNLEFIKRLNAFRYQLIGVYKRRQDAYIAIPHGANIQDESCGEEDVAVLKYEDRYFIYPYCEGDDFDWFEFFDTVYGIQAYLEFREFGFEAPEGCVSFPCFDEDIERLYRSFEGGLESFADMDWLADDLDTLFELIAEQITVEIMFDLPCKFDVFRFVILEPYRLRMYSEGDKLY